MPHKVLPHLSLIPQDPKWHRVWYGEWQKLEVECRLVKLEVYSAVGPGWRIVEALAKQWQTCALPAGGGTLWYVTLG